MKEQFLWVERYRPNKVDDVILPKRLKSVFQSFVEQKCVPNLLLNGGPGCGKTTVVKAMLRELNCEYITINGSMKGNIDTLRNEIQDFASTISMLGGRKYVILDEADYLNMNSTQPALRNFMESYSHNCGFVLTSNYAHKIIKELHSRCSVIEFRFDKKEIPALAVQFLKRIKTILDVEGIQYEEAVVAELINQWFPDFRRIINELQRYSANGIIDSGILAHIKGPELTPLIKLIKEKDYTGARVWIANNVDSSVRFFRDFYDFSKNVSPNVAPALVLLIGKYSYQDAFMVDKEINLAAFVAEVMVEQIL